jgi:glycine amidinotransferase
MSVNVYTEWGRLREIIVGSCVNLTDYNIDASFRLFFHSSVKDPFVKNSLTLQKKLVEQRQEDLDGLTDFLKKMDIVVHRPRPLEKIEKFKTLTFEDWLCPVHNPRDRVLIAGDEIIESPAQMRRRYFETDLLKDIFREYFRKGARWTEVPRPLMELNSFDFSALSPDDPSIPWSEYQNDERRFEIMFDAAQCFKFGRDIVMNVSNRNHELGATWLTRHLGDRFRIHVVRMTDYHIDGMFMPLRPGVLLLNHTTMPGKVNLLPKALQKWDMITVPEEHRESSDGQGFPLASANINVNVLPLNEREVLVFNETGTPETALFRLLERHGFTPIPVRLRHSRLFDGGLHCATLDTVREDSCDDFFTG